ncbi:hypothetical protein [Nocardioides pakistanensis]
MTTPPLDTTDYVRELTERHTNRAHYTLRKGDTWYGQDHLTTVPPLLEQLWHADTPSPTAEDGPRPGYGSKPTARLEALDVAVRIDLEASRWVRELGEDDPGDTIRCVRLLHSLLPSAHEVTRRAAGKDIRRWWTQARVATGWDSPAWRPDNTCPMCGTRGTLRVNLASQGGFCVECRETWDESNIGLLADHIRGESEAERSPRRGRVACYCPITVMPNGQVARPVITGLRLCPVCGSARCVHALEQPDTREQQRGA